VRRVAPGLLLCVVLLLGGCGTTPFGPETVAPIEETGVRITEGVGTAAGYTDSVDVGAGNVAEFRATVGDGKDVIFSIPRGPATTLVGTFRLEGSAEVLGTVTLHSRDGKPCRLGEAFEYNPGFVGVEHHSDAEEVELRLAFPRLIDLGQGQVHFTFKVPVH